MGIARRWMMKGPWQHQNGVYYYRGEVPKDVWDGRERLAALGVRLGRGKELRRSLKTRDRKPAEKRYAEVAAELDARWEVLRETLSTGPTSLSERSVVALAGEGAKRFLDEHGDNPSAGLVRAPIAEPQVSSKLLAEIERLVDADQTRLRSALADTAELSTSELVARMQGWNDDPVLSIIGRALLEPVAAHLVRKHGPALQAALDRHGLVVDRHAQAALVIKAIELHAKVRRTLRDRTETDDYREPEWVKGLPEFQPPVGAHTFASVIDAEAKRRALGKDARPLPARTIASFGAICAALASFRGKGGRNIGTLTANELDSWKAALMTGSSLSSRTVANRLTVVKTVVGWARGLYRGRFVSLASELEEVASPDYTPKPSDLSSIHPDEAPIILRAARQQSDARLRWLPWLCAYSGLRIAEAAQLRTSDFFDSEGHWFFDVTTSGKRSLKTVNSRRTIPVHRALIAEGFRDYVEGLPEGPLFGRGAAVAVTRWFHTITGIHEGVSPNHGWRHLFKDLCRRYGLSDDARHYLAGHSTGGADQAYGRTRAMLPGLWRQVERIKPFRL